MLVLKKVKIVTDSTVDFSESELEQYDIKVVPLSVMIEGETYLDRIDIKPKEFVKKLKESNEMPKTSQPSVGAFLDVYNELGSDGSDILSIHITEGMSGTAGSARSAAEMSDANVTVVNSGFISVAMSFQVIEAAKMAQNGSTLEEIIERLETIRSNTSLFLMVDTLEYLQKGGRLGRGATFIGTLLKIKPIASLADGVYTPVTKVRTYNQFINFCIEQIKQDSNNRKIKGVGIAHAEAGDLALRVKEEIETNTNFSNTVIVDTTPVISAHAGPGAIALMYYLE